MKVSKNAPVAPSAWNQLVAGSLHAGRLVAAVEERRAEVHRPLGDDRLRRRRRRSRTTGRPAREWRRRTRSAATSAPTVTTRVHRAADLGQERHGHRGAASALALASSTNVSKKPCEPSPKSQRVLRARPPRCRCARRSSCRSQNIVRSTTSGSAVGRRHHGRDGRGLEARQLSTAIVGATGAPAPSASAAPSCRPP